MDYALTTSCYDPGPARTSVRTLRTAASCGRKGFERADSSAAGSARPIFQLPIGNWQLEIENWQFMPPQVC